MALHPKFPGSPHEIFDPAVRWFPADENLKSGKAKAVDIFGNDTMKIMEVAV